MKTKDEFDKVQSAAADHELQEANTCLAMGAGIGAAGVGSAALVGATCPLCVVFAPALLGFGAWKRYTVKKKQKETASIDRTLTEQNTV